MSNKHNLFNQDGSLVITDYIIITIALIVLGALIIYTPSKPIHIPDIGNNVAYYKVCFKKPIMIDNSISVDCLSVNRLSYNEGILTLESEDHQNKISVKFTNIKSIKAYAMVGIKG